MFTNFQLKLIALFFMTLSHIEYHLQINSWLYVGQLSFFIFAFLISEGYRHTHNRKQYIIRFFIFGMFLQIPLWILKYDYINIFFTLGLGALAIDSLEKKNFFLLSPILVLAYLFNFDYGLYGIIVIITMYYCNFKQIFFILLSLNFLYINILEYYPLEQYFSMLALPFIYLYNGKLGYRKLKYLFYFYYPLHIIIIVGVKNFL